MPETKKPSKRKLIEADLLGTNLRQVEIARNHGVGRQYVSWVARKLGLSQQPDWAGDGTERFTRCFKMTQAELKALKVVVEYETETHGRTSQSQVLRKLIKEKERIIERASKRMQRVPTTAGKN